MKLKELLGYLRHECIVDIFDCDLIDDDWWDDDDIRGVAIRDTSGKCEYYG